MVVLLTDAEIAAAALADESLYRFNSFTPEDALAIGMAIRKRFLSSYPSEDGRFPSDCPPSLLISIRTLQGVPLFACSVGGGQTVLGMDGWKLVDGMARVVRRTGHSTLYVEKGLKAMGKTLESLGISHPPGIPKDVVGGGFPVWIKTVPSAPVGIIIVYSGSPIEDHQLITSTLRHWTARRQPTQTSTPPDMRSMPTATER